MPNAQEMPLRREAATQSGRVLTLLDLENLAGGASFSQEEATRIYEAHTAVAPTGQVNHVVVATSHRAATAAWFGLPKNVRRLVRSGVDGADLALLRVLQTEDISSRYDRVVIGSGDGIFSFECARLQAAGVAVTVVAHRGGLSKRLRLAVPDVRYLEPEVNVATIGLVLR